jgi:hypothetical protein
MESFVRNELNEDNEDTYLHSNRREQMFWAKRDKRMIIVNIWRISMNIWRSEKTNINHRFMELKSMNLVMVLGNQISSLQTIITK